MIKETHFFYQCCSTASWETAQNMAALNIQIKNQVLLTSAKYIINLVVCTAYPAKLRKVQIVQIFQAHFI